MTLRYNYVCRSLQLINRDLSEEFYTLSSFPDSLYKKVTLLKYFRSYMTEHLLKAGGSAGTCICLFLDFLCHS